MWNNLFFLYSVAVMIMSGIVNAKLEDVSANKIKGLNYVVLAMSIALSSFVIGIMFGQSSYACENSRSLEPCNVASQVALLMIALVVEGLLIAILSHDEFKALGDDNKPAKNMLIAMLALNSVGIAGGVLFVAYPRLKGLYECGM